MIRLPDVFGLTLCKEMAVDVSARQMSLIGVFHALRFPSFPSPSQPFTVYAALYGGTGEGIMELVCTRLETEEDVYRYQRWSVLPGPGVLTNLEIRVHRCVFPAPGRYGLTLLLDREEVSRRYLDVTRLRGGT